MQDREYQIRGVSEVVDALYKYRTVLRQLPTGGGKTVEFSMISKMFIQRLIDINVEPGPVLILVHREELLHQAAKAVKSILGFEPCLITSKTDRFWISRVYIGMATSTMNRLHMINNPSLIIVDEAHLQDFIKVHKQFPNTKFLAFTATPLSASKREPLKRYYQKIICGPTIKQLISLGYLSQNITRAPDVSIDTSDFAYDRLINDYNQRQVANAYRMTANVTNCINQYFEYCLNKKTLVFNVNIEHSKEVTECFNACGFPAKHLDANSLDRKDIFKWFKETPNAILCSVMIPTMGFDEPTVESIILNYSTLSLVKFVQTCGRGSRIIDELFIMEHQHEYPYKLKIKDHFDIIDLGQNWKNFGDWNDERDWERIFNFPDFPTDGIAPVKTCPKCRSLLHAAIRICPFCEYVFPRKQGKQVDIEEMILITKGIDVDAINERSEKKYKYFPFFEMAIDVVSDMITMYGDNLSQSAVDFHFKKYYNMCIEWYDKTLAHKETEIGDIRQSGWHIRKAKNNFNSLITNRNKKFPLVTDEKKILNPEYHSQQELSWKNFGLTNESFNI